MTTLLLDDLLTLRHSVKQEKPLIHCITNHITINDCANAVLSVGAKPIMAEHPDEVAAITASAQALAVNLGNINDTRMKACQISGKTALEYTIPSIIDIVGVSCSPLRLAFAHHFIAEYRPSIIKGNMSELKALCGQHTEAKGIDVSEQDRLTQNSIANTHTQLAALALKTSAVVVATGAIDMITDGTTTCLIENGCEMLSLITGTGCVLNVLIAAFMSSKKPLASAVLATALMGICGELSQNAKGPATFKIDLLDYLYSLSNETFKNKILYKIL